MDFSQESLENLGAEAKARIDQGDKAKDRSEQLYKSAGLYLKEAKQRVGLRKDMTWAQYLVKHCPVGRRRADECIYLADGRTTLQALNDAKNAARSPAASVRHERRVRANSGEKPEQKQQNSLLTAVERARSVVDAEHAKALREGVALLRKLDPEKLAAVIAYIKGMK